MPRRRKPDKISNKPHQEVEVKLRIADREAFLRRLAQLGATLTAPRMHEMNTLYDTPDGHLAKGGQMTRIRVERPADGRQLGNRGESKKDERKAAETANRGSVATLTYKGPPGSRAGGYKVRDEHEVRNANAKMLESICRLMGLRPWFRYEKYRSKYALPDVPGVELDLDETPVGDYLELEGDRASIDRAARLLGFSRADYIVKSYGGLFMESLQMRGKPFSKKEPTPGLGVPDMLFRAAESVRKRSSVRKISKIKKL